MRRRTAGGARGFSLLEVVIVLAVLAILVGLVTPMAFQLFEAERASSVEQELKTMYAAIAGDRAQGVFGYVGDVGTYPASLRDLVVPPIDEKGTHVPGWKGPYLQNPRIESQVLLDPFGRPYEYYLAAGADGPDQLALISRGPDGLSTNRATEPNSANDYTGPSPVDPAYLTGAHNADNIVFPSPQGSAALNVVIRGDAVFDIVNWDANKQVSAFVPTCPDLYTLEAISVARGTREANAAYVQGLALNLVQGHYRVTVSPKGAPVPAWTGTITVLPGATLTRSLNLTGLDSSGTPRFDLTVKNRFTATALEVFEFDQRLASTDNKTFVWPGQVKTFTPRGCAQIYVRERRKDLIVDQFVMPYRSTTRIEGPGLASPP